MAMSLAMPASSAIFLSFSALRLSAPGSSGGGGASTSAAATFARPRPPASPAALSLVLNGHPSRRPTASQLSIHADSCEPTSCADESNLCLAVDLLGGQDGWYLAA